MPTKPHILFVILDTQRRDHLSLYGHSRDTAPQMAAFAQGATVFERAIAPAQWTIPAHGSLFTGLYASAHGLTQAYQSMSGQFPMLAEILQQSDYHTAAFCNNPLLGLLETGLQRGFDHFYNYAGATPNRPMDMRRSIVRRAAATQIRQFARRVTNQFAHSDAMFRTSLSPLLVPIWSRLVNFKGNAAQSIDDLIDYWGQHTAGGADKPLFAFLNLMGTHLPYRPPQAWLKHVAPEIAQDRQAYGFMTRFNADGVGWISPTDAPLADWQRHTLDAFYDAEIAYQDEQLGRLWAYLKASDTLDNTLVIVAADHGEGHGDHGYMGHSFVVYQELVHVPLFIHHPAFPAGKHITTPVSTRRIFHTILEAAGAVPPIDEADPNANVEGLSLARSLNGRPDTECGVAFAEAFPPVNLLNIIEERQPQMVERLALREVRRGVVVGDHKVALVGDRIENLYNIAADPGEAHDIAAEQPQIAAALQQQVAQFVTAQQAQSQAADNQSMSGDVLENLRALGYIE